MNLLIKIYMCRPWKFIDSPLVRRVRPVKNRSSIKTLLKNKGKVSKMR